MKDIDYEIQFKTLDTVDFHAVDEQWQKRHRYYTAEAAFRSARRLEGQGFGVAFAKYGDTYYVWSE